jgi:inhibitor of KinA sporulation pathway (predicted exonuclease)
MSKVIVIDLEMNQPSKKIIQLGYVIGNARKGQIIKSVCVNVNPNESLHPDIIKLTSITDEQVLSAGTLMEAYGLMCADIQRYNVSKTCVQWGIGDSNELRRQLGLTYDEYVFRNRTFDVKSLFQMNQLFNNNSVAMGLKAACEEFNIEFTGQEHNAEADAINTFKLFCDLGNTMVLSTKIRKLLDE